MSITPREILAMPSLRVEEGFSNTVLELFEYESGENGDNDNLKNAVQRYREDPETKKLASRLMTQTKAEQIVENGDGRYSLDVVYFDTRPIAIVVSGGYETVTYSIVRLDVDSIDELVKKLTSLFIQYLPDMNVGLDEDVSRIFYLNPSLIDKVKNN